ncbi:MAG: hypothetical protein U9O94_11665 [Nanoarchaeota archaeon]|nr:hypothetical protein [Nanoarchaeota archaeon]
MAHVCPMQGCKEKQGMCMHEKMMLRLVVVVIIVVIFKTLI